VVRVGGLVAAGAAKPQVVAAVLIYRALTWLLPIPLGIGCYLWWRRQSRVASPNLAPSAITAARP
jgi:putative heme transporter